MGLGDIHWTPPVWLRQVAAFLVRAWTSVRRYPRRSGLIAAAVVVIGLGAFAGWRLYQALPKPVEYEATVTSPERTCIECAPPGKPNTVAVHFSGSVAPLSDSGKVIEPAKSGLTMDPTFAGEWRWTDDKTLVFTPKADWPIGRAMTNAHPQVAWKTGTSWGFRDAWTVGVFGPYALAVWVGNFDGSSNAALVGVQTAAPLFFHIVDGIHASDPRLVHTGEIPHPCQYRASPHTDR